MVKGSTLNIAKVILSILIVSLLVVNLRTIDRIDKVNKAFTSRHNEATWFVFQLVKEYSNFLMLARTESVDFKTLWLSYDITWSRFDILLNSQESANFIEAANFQAYFEQEFAKLQALESSIKLVESGKISPELLAKKIQLTYQGLISFINDNFRLQSPIIERNTKEMDRLLTLHRLSLMSLSVLFIAVIFIFLLESRLRRVTLLSDSLTKLYDRAALMRFAKNSAHENESYSLISLKVRNLDEINQKYGLDYGDIVLVDLAKKLVKLTPRGCQSYRFSGKHFIMVGQCIKPAQEKETIRLLRKEMEKPIEVGNLTFISDTAIKTELLPKRMILDHLTSLSREQISTHEAHSG